MPAARMQDGMGGVMAERAPLVRAGRGDYPAPVKSVCVAPITLRLLVPGSGVWSLASGFVPMHGWACG